MWTATHGVSACNGASATLIRGIESFSFSAPMTKLGIASSKLVLPALGQQYKAKYIKAKRNRVRLARLQRPSVLVAGIENDRACAGCATRLAPWLATIIRFVLDKRAVVPR